MTAREAKSQYLLREWADRISERSKSGLTVKAWCAENGVNVRQYNYWLHRVREYAAQFMPARYAKPVISQDPADAPNGWALVKAGTEAAQPSVYSEESALPNAYGKESVPAERGSVAVEIGGFRVTATADVKKALFSCLSEVLRQLKTPSSEDTLKKVFRTLVSIC